MVFLATAVFGLPTSFEVVDHVHDLLDGGVGRLERRDHFVFSGFLGAGLDHHDRRLAAGHHEVNLARLALRVGRVDDELSVHQADAHGGNRLFEGIVEMASAADAPVIASTSESFSASARINMPMICVS